jgi:hypothetical protein
MNAKWRFFAIVLILGFGIFMLTEGQREAVAKYVFFCLLTAVIIKPVGLVIGNLIGKIINRD